MAFQPPNLPLQKGKTQAFVEGLGQGSQNAVSLANLWRQHKLQKIQQEMAIREAESKYGTGRAENIMPGQVTSVPSGGPEEEFLGAEITPPTFTEETPEQKLRRLGTENYKILNPQQYGSYVIGPNGAPQLLQFPSGVKPGPAVPTPTTILSPEGYPVGQAPGKTTVLPKSDEDKTRAKIEAERPKATGSYNALLRQYDNMINEARAIKEDPKLSGATGLFGGRMNATEGQRRISSNLDTLKAKTLINVLSSMKELSKNGASGFGALSELEGENLKNSIASLNRKQGTKDFQKSLDKFIMEIEAKKKDITDTFNSTYGAISGSSGDNDPLGLR